jgi:hypothetical protein
LPSELARGISCRRRRPLYGNGIDLTPQILLEYILTLERSGLPPGLHKQFLNKGEAATSGKVGWVYDLVLGEYGSFYMAWRDKDNKNWQGITFKQLKYS